MLATVLSLQILGGDPEAAYLTVLAGALYALVIAANNNAKLRSPRLWAVATILAWIVVTLTAAYALPRIAVPEWLPSAAILRGLLWALLALAALWRCRKRPSESSLASMLVSLAAASAFAAALAAVQLVPTLEYATNTVRAADDRPERIYGFEMEPYRLIEVLWPNVFGMSWPVNRSWIQALPPADERMLWVPSLYVGGLTVALALGALGFRAGPPWRIWLSLIAGIALAASCGKFGGPLWIVRWFTSVQPILGPHDPLKGLNRVDPFLHDGAGSVYGLLAALLPGFNLFRYPGKLFSFTALALAALAGHGWDRLEQGHTRKIRRGCAGALAASLAALALLLETRESLVAWLTRHLPPDLEFGPVDPRQAINATALSLVHGTLVFALATGLTFLAPRRPRIAAPLAIILLAIDLAIANAPLVWTVPQQNFEFPSCAGQGITEAERVDPSAGPFRVHRVEMLFPKGLARRPARRWLREMIAWKRNSLEPLFGLPLGLEHTLLQGILESDDYVQFFGSILVTPRDSLGIASGPPMYAFPRRGIDLWNSRYVVMSVNANGWLGQSAGFERIAPSDEVVQDPGRAKQWIEDANWQLLRNKDAYARAWLVHMARVRKPARGRSDRERFELMKDLVFQADAYLREPGRPLIDTRFMAIVETDQPQGLAGYVSRNAVSLAESVVVTRHEPQRVELHATLERPGLVILADAYYPGWNLTIDGQIAPIYRTNRLMRGAAVKAGQHALVYTYNPASVRIGAMLSIAGLIALAGLIPWACGGRIRNFLLRKLARVRDKPGGNSGEDWP